MVAVAKEKTHATSKGSKTEQKQQRRRQQQQRDSERGVKIFSAASFFDDDGPKLRCYLKEEGDKDKMEQKKSENGEE